MPDHLRARRLSPRYPIAAGHPITMAWPPGRDFLNGAASRASSYRSGRTWAARSSSRTISFCGIDPRGLSDRYADYWQQNVQSHAHQLRALRSQSAWLQRLRTALLGLDGQRHPSMATPRMRPTTISASSRPTRRVGELPLCAGGGHGGAAPFLRGSRRQDLGALRLRRWLQRTARLVRRQLISRSARGRSSS